MSAGVEAQPIEYDIELGKHYSAAVESQMGVYNDAGLTSLVSSIGNKLVQALGKQPFDYSFKVADTDITNAFALPGGFTYITRGLLALVNDESELAGVMAHEIIHVDRRHSIQQMHRGGFLPGLLRLPGQIVGAFSPAIGSILLAPVDSTAAACDANYSRSHEKEADKDGVVLAAKASYDPNGLTKLLENLAIEAELLSGEPEKAKLLDDHPITPKRLKYLNKKISKIDDVNTTVGNQSILDLLDGMTYGQNPAQGVIVNNKFMHPDMRLFMQFPADWQTANTPVMVGAIEADSEAMVTLVATDNAHTPQGYCDTIVSRIPEENTSMIKENKPIVLNGFSGHSLILIDDSGTNHAFMHVVWLYVGSNVFQLSAYGLDEHKETLESSLFSLRSLTEEERTSIQIRKIRITKARSGESLKELSERVGNVLDLKMTAVINATDLASKFKAGQKIKVVLQSAYVTK